MGDGAGLLDRVRAMYPAGGRGRIRSAAPELRDRPVRAPQQVMLPMEIELESMLEPLNQAVHAFEVFSTGANARSFSDLGVAPSISVFLELPLYLLVVAGMLRYGIRRWQRHRHTGQHERYPSVSCLVTCYSEGEGCAQDHRLIGVSALSRPD